jgi:phosphoserine phosphatase RsbU/P
VDNKPRILLADDDRIATKICKRVLNISGYDVDTAENGVVALEKYRAGDYAILITDWMMPEMDGPELVEKVRSISEKSFIYIIMLTARSETGDLVHGFKSGADDYLTKPFEKDELLARVTAGMRIRNLNRRIQMQNDLMVKDLDAARKAQESLLPKDFPDVPGIEFGAFMISSAFVGGDIYNIFRLDDDHIGFYQVDVSGHGVPSSLFSVSISQMLTHDLYQHNLLRIPISPSEQFKINSPAHVVALLNETNMLEKHGHYFTMIYAILNIRTGELTFSRAGHNLPLVVHPDGSSEFIKNGAGGPVGFGLPRDDDEELTLKLEPGDAFILYSDGITDAGVMLDSNASYGCERIQEVMRANSGASLNDTFLSLIDDVRSHVVNLGGERYGSFDDDVSIIGVRWNPDK